MRITSLFLLIMMVSCSTGKEGTDARRTSAPSDISKESFKKDKALNTNDVKDFYVEKPKSLNPALQDETLDRYSVEELNVLSDSKDPLVEIALRCSKKDFERAFSAASKAFNRYQKIPAYWNLIANCHLNQGSNRKALLFYNKALEVSPGYVPALNNIGVLYSRQGDDQKALVAFEKANNKSRFAKTPRYNLARLYLSYGLADAALPLFQGLLNEGHQDADILNAVASSYFLKGDYQRAASYFARIPSSVLDRAEIGLNYAMTLKKLGKLQDAKKVFSDVDQPKTKSLRDYYASIGNQLGVQ